MAITKDQINAAKNAAPGDEFSIFANTEHDIEWLVKVPNDGEWQSWRAQQSAAGDDITPINREFLISHIVIPDARQDPKVREKLSRWPGLVEAGVRALAKLAGARAEFSVKKV